MGQVSAVVLDLPITPEIRVLNNNFLRLPPLAVPTGQPKSSL